MPYAFSPLSYDQDQATDILKLIKSDVLKHLSFQVKYESQGLVQSLEAIKSLRNLEKLQINLHVKDSLLKLLNKNLTRECRVRDLDIVFCQEAASDYQRDKKHEPVSFEIKFPLYLKHLRRLALTNICDKNFTETLFDMASQSKLKALSLSMINDQQSLPNFAEAIARFTALESLHLSKIQYNKINQGIFLSFINQSNLRSLSLDAINFSDSQFKVFLQKINDSQNLQELSLQQIYLDTDFKLELMNSFLAGNKRLTKITLAQNMLNSLEVLSQIFVNKKLRELTLMQQSFFKTSLMAPQRVNDKGATAAAAYQSERLLSEKEEEELFSNKCDNKSLEKLTLSLGLMATIKPLVQCFQTFTHLKILIINNITLNQLHFMAIDNFVLSNPHLRKLSLINVSMNNESFKLLSRSLAQSTSLRAVNLSQNQLKDSGALELSEVVRFNNSLQRIKVD